MIEVSRHGVRPPTEGNVKTIQEGTGRDWPTWLTHYGELTGHGYAAAVLKGQYEGQYLRQHGLLTHHCPASDDVFVWSQPAATHAGNRHGVDGWRISRLRRCNSRPGE